jgi:N-acetylglutamate synthase-like GNAT family acetyltransferase
VFRWIGGFKMICTRRATLEDLVAINQLTFEMHNHLGRLVGLRFKKQDLAEEMYQGEDDLKNVYVAENNAEVVGCIASPKRFSKTNFSADTFTCIT